MTKAEFPLNNFFSAGVIIVALTISTLIIYAAAIAYVLAIILIPSMLMEILGIWPVIVFLLFLVLLWLRLPAGAQQKIIQTFPCNW
jgi:hypothetical protein